MSNIMLVFVAIIMLILAFLAIAGTCMGLELLFDYLETWVELKTDAMRERARERRRPSSVRQDDGCKLVGWLGKRYWKNGGGCTEPTTVDGATGYEWTDVDAEWK